MGSWLALDNNHGYAAAVQPGGFRMLPVQPACAAADAAQQNDENFADNFPSWAVTVAEPLASVAFSSDGTFLLAASARTLFFYTTRGLVQTKEASVPFATQTFEADIDEVLWNVGRNGAPPKTAKAAAKAEAKPVTWGHYIAVVSGGRLSIHSITTQGCELVKILDPLPEAGAITSVTWPMPGTRGVKLMAGTTSGSTVVAG
jgi:hypothetical protein